MWSVSAAELTGDKKDVYGTLVKYYDAAKAEDINAYLAVQDQQYWEIAAGLDNYKTYISAVFDATDTASYEIINPTILIQDNRALVYYELKASITIKGTSEKKDIDNDMVAFLFKYPEGWKLRYSMLRELFDYKMDAGTLENIAAADTYIMNDNSSLKQQMISEGVLTKAELENVVSNTAAANQKNDAASNGAGPVVLWIIIAIVIIAAVLFFVFKKKKPHK